jgi:transmembrane 9 superfamily member 2/4
MHLFSLCNSGLLAALLLGFVGIAFFKDSSSDKKDTEGNLEKPISMEENGWKLVRNEAFHVPETKNILCAFFGTGIQFFLIVFSIYHQITYSGS